MSTKLSLRKRILQGASWIMVGHISGQLLRLASNLIMTRLLVPEMFGLMAIANVILIGLAMMSDVGIRQHIIQSDRSDSVDFLNSAWVVQILRGILLWGVALIVSWILSGLLANNWWPVNSVYADPKLPIIIAVLSFASVIIGFESTKLAMANRNLAMKQVVKIELISQLAGILFMLGWALLDRSIWALVFGGLISSLLKSVLSHVMLSGHSNKLHLDRESFYELIHFGKWIFLASVLGFLAMHGDKLILGGLINAKVMGVYTIALFIVGAIQIVFSKIITSIALPALSEVVRTRPDQLKKVYYKFRLPIDAVTLLLAGILFMSGHHIIDILYDDRYKSAGLMLEILSLMLLMERFSLTGQCFIALGKPSYLIPMISARLPVLYIILPVIYGYYGLEGALWIIGLNRTIILPILFWLKLKNNILDVKNEMLFMSFLVFGCILGWVINIIFGLGGSI